MILKKCLCIEYIFNKFNFDIKTKIDSLLLELVKKIIMSFEI